MENKRFSMLSPMRGSLIVFSVLLLGAVYIFQRFSYAGLLYNWTSLEYLNLPNVAFAVNRTIRLLINDGLCMLLILGLFQKRSYLQLAFIVFLFELLVMLPLYLYLKLTLEGPSEISSPLLSPIHRMIVNPLLMIVLIGAFYYQRLVTSIK